MGGGALGDRINRRIGLTACLLGHSVALFGLAFSTIICQVAIFATLHGVVWGARAPMAVSIRADYFGRSNYATIMEFSSLVRMSGMMLARSSPDIWQTGWETTSWHSPSWRP